MRKQGKTKGKVMDLSRQMEIVRWLLKNGMNKADVDRVDKGLNAALLKTGWTNGSYCCSPALKGPKQLYYIGNLKS